MRRRRARLCHWLLGSCVCASLAASEVRADADAVAWKPEWPKVQAFEYIATGVFAVTAVSVALTVDPRSSGTRDAWLFDAPLRDLVRARTRQGRDRARVVGDLGYRVLLIYPFLDALVTPWAIHGNAEVAWQMFAIDAEALAFAGMLGLLADHLIGRARPSELPCRKDADYEAFCGEADAYGSFFSGHSAIAAAGAGLTCAHHLNLPLYGGGAQEIAVCAAASALAVTTGIARMANDRHWATDVTTGLLIGGLTGYLVPTLLHYRGAARSEATTAAQQRAFVRFIPLITSTGVSGMLLGRY